MPLLYEKLTYQIRKCIFEVRKEIGAGYDEETYHQALIVSFSKNNIPYLSKEKRALKHRNILIRNFINDFLLYDKIILSLKCVPYKFTQKHYVQLFNELKLWKKGLGLIVNFGLPDLDIERYIYEEPEPFIVEKYDYIKDTITSEEREILIQLRKAIKSVVEMHKLGYGKGAWRKILEVEMKFLRLSCERNKMINIQFEGTTVRQYSLRHFIIENKIIAGITALQDNINQVDIANMQSYLRRLKLGVGIVVNFGKSELQIVGVRAPLGSKTPTEE